MRNLKRYRTLLVLAAVLLHVIESARPVDFAVYAIADG